MDLNPTTTQPDPSVADSTETRNYAGGVAYEADTPEKGLMMVCMANLLEGGFYHDADDELQMVRDRFDAVARTNPEFILQTANFVRHKMYLRDIPVVLLVEAAHDDRTKQYVRRYAPAIISRPDELATALAYHNRLAGKRKSPPQALKKGLRDAFFNFDKHELTKWQQQSRRVSLVDVLNVVRPNPHCERAQQSDTDYDEVFERLALGDLDDYPVIEPLRQGDPDDASTMTWEAVYSDKRDVATTAFTTTLPVAESTTHTDADAGLTVHLHPQGVTSPNDTSQMRLTVEDETGSPVGGALVTVEQPSTFGRLVVGCAGTHQTDADGTLTLRDVPNSPTTVQISVRRDNAAEAWRAVLRSDDVSMGLYARIKNVRNMLDAGLAGEEVFGDADMDWVRNASLFPFRYWQAYDALHEAGLHDDYALDWLTDAIDASAHNLPGQLSDSFVAVDVSGSMDNSPVSNRSDLDRIDIATLFGAVLMNKGADVGVFSDDFATIDDAHYGEPTVALKDRIETEIPHSGTNGHLPLDSLRADQTEYDRIIYLTDEQLWDSTSGIGRRSDRTLKDAWDEYRRTVSTDTQLYICNLADYGTLSMPEGYPNVYHMSGWSEKLFDFIELAEEQDAIRHEIKTDWHA